MIGQTTQARGERGPEGRAAVAVGFEPTVSSSPTHDFESCSFGRSDTPPREILRVAPGSDEISGPVGPLPQPWPTDPRLDPELLANGDARNVIDRFRYWTVAAIRDELATSRSALHIGIENLGHDFNIGSIVRTANAFNVAAVHLIGRRRWNRRGAMVTDAYLDIVHHPTPADFLAWCARHSLPVLAIDNVPGAVALESADLPLEAVMLFGCEGAGLSAELLTGAAAVLAITQYGSTRSINVAAAAAIAMHSWVRTHRSG